MKSVLATQDEILNQKINTECGAVRDDTNHKLALQVAENKRMQALLAKATDDCNRLTRLCENLSVRVQILEAHTCVFSPGRRACGPEAVGRSARAPRDAAHQLTELF